MHHENTPKRSQKTVPHMIHLNVLYTVNKRLKRLPIVHQELPNPVFRFVIVMTPIHEQIDQEVTAPQAQGCSPCGCV